MNTDFNIAKENACLILINSDFKRKQKNIVWNELSVALHLSNLCLWKKSLLSNSNFSILLKCAVFAIPMGLCWFSSVSLFGFPFDCKQSGCLLRKIIN